jgi:hypothetical protein
MTHKSNFSDIFWYIDSVNQKDNNLYEVNGWIFCETGTIQKIRIENNEYSKKKYAKNIREDVKSFYPNIPDKFIGWTFTVDSNLINSPIDVILDSGLEYRNIGNINSWVVFNSGFNPNSYKDIIVVDNFYMNPDLVRNHAINNLSFLESDYHRGKRSDSKFILNGTLEKFEEILGRKIYNWNNPNYANGIFQYCTSTDPIVYHVDSQNYAAMVYLTPNAPLQSGTATYRSIYTKQTKFDDTNMEFYDKTFKGLSNELNFYDKTSFELVDNIANVYNRLILFNSKYIHAAVNYFGDTKDNSRFFHLFFFDI